MALPESKDLTYFFSEETRARKPSPLKTCIHLFNDPNIIFLGGGLPLADYFPWDNVEYDFPQPPFSRGIGHPLMPGESSTQNADVSRATLRKKDKLHAGDVPLARALQYGFSQGQPELLEFLREHTKLIHTMQYSDWDVLATAGSTNAWESTLRVFCNKGDVVLFESYSFSSCLAASQAQGIVTFPVPIDENGIIPEKLETILDNWTPGARKPKILYTIPTGQNPTGSSLADDRKPKIYALAQKHDFLIVEDEPYYFLQMNKYTRDESVREAELNQPPLPHDQFLKSLAKTFLSLDTDGRVIRMDSFSKVLAPGSRLGWITGSKKLLSAYLALHEMTIQAPSGFTQAMVSSLLHRWGQDGYLDWLICLRKEYTIKRNNAIDYLHEFVPPSPAFKINPPIAGMFFILQIDASVHPEFKTKFNSDPQKVEQYLYEKVIKNGVLVVPGIWFVTEGDTVPPQPQSSKEKHDPNVIFFRGTYAAVAPEKLKEGIKRFCDMLCAEFGIERN